MFHRTLSRPIKRPLTHLPFNLSFPLLLHFTNLPLPLLMQRGTQILQCHPSCHVLRQLLVRPVSLAHLKPVQLQTGIVPHARIVKLFLLCKVKLRNTLEKLLPNLCQQRYFICINAYDLPNLSINVPVELCDLPAHLFT